VNESPLLGIRIQFDVAENRLILRKKSLHPDVWKAGYTGTEVLKFAVAANFEPRQNIWWCGLFKSVHRTDVS
jgi:hypothetical protein